MNLMRKQIRTEVSAKVAHPHSRRLEGAEVGTLFQLFLASPLDTLHAITPRK